MKFYMLSFLLMSLLLSTFSTEAQQRRWNPKHRFKAAVLLGASISQMDGDNFVGYDKMGIQAGVRGTALLSRHVQLNVELLLSQKGARVESDPRVLFPKKNRILALNYAEVPFMVRYTSGEDGKGTFLEGGLSFARLLSNRIEEDTTILEHTFTELQERFKKNELSFVGGLGQQLTPNIGIGFRATFGMSYIMDRRDEIEKKSISTTALVPSYAREIQFLRNYFVTFYANYVF